MNLGPLPKWPPQRQLSFPEILFAVRERRLFCWVGLCIGNLVTRFSELRAARPGLTSFP